jgi:hypothetical protein
VNEKKEPLLRPQLAERAEPAGERVVSTSPQDDPLVVELVEAPSKAESPADETSICMANRAKARRLEDLRSSVFPRQHAGW